MPKNLRKTGRLNHQNYIPKTFLSLLYPEINGPTMSIVTENFSATLSLSLVHLYKTPVNKGFFDSADETM